MAMESEGVCCSCIDLFFLVLRHRCRAGSPTASASTTTWRTCASLRRPASRRCCGSCCGWCFCGALRNCSAAQPSATHSVRELHFAHRTVAPPRGRSWSSAVHVTSARVCTRGGCTTHTGKHLMPCCVVPLHALLTHEVVGFRRNTSLVPFVYFPGRAVIFAMWDFVVCGRSTAVDVVRSTARVDGVVWLFTGPASRPTHCP